MTGSVVFLMSHAANERMSKRMETVSALCDKVDVVYWDRFSDASRGVIPKGVQVRQLDSPWHRNGPLRRLAETALVTFRVLLWLRKEQASSPILYLEGADMLLPAVLHKRLQKKTRLVWEIADLPGTTYEGSWLNHQIWRFVVRSAGLVDLCVFTSPGYVQYMADQGVHFDRTLVLENLPRRGFVTDAEPRVPRRARLTVGCFGRVFDVQRLGMLSDAAHGVDGVATVIAGGGADLTALREHCRQRPETTIVGSYSYADIAGLYHSVDVVYVPYDPTSPNNQVALPTRLYDAVAFGIPVIVPPGTLLAREVQKRKVGVVLKSDSTEELRLVLARLADSRNSELTELRKSIQVYPGPKYWEEEEPLLQSELAQMLGS